MVGILGANGAGKSTLLQLIGGIGCADEGQILTLAESAPCWTWVQGFILT
jgi:ABC-type polysaccharide/polyol phosphate transport system ATPase subunit